MLTRAPSHDRPRLLVCPPDYFDVHYAINPWMKPADWSREARRFTHDAAESWRQLVETYRSLGAEIEVLEPEPGLPDLVFTANHAVVLDGRALLSRYRFAERQGEESPVRSLFDRLLAQGVVRSLHAPPPGVFLEGAGDAVWDASRGHFWLGYGPRTSREAKPVVEDVFGVPVLALELVDPRFYHLDTCLFALEGGEVVHFPDAFSREGRGLLRDIAGSDRLIGAPEEDALQLAVNAFALGRDVVMSGCSDRLRAVLAERGYRVHVVPLAPFALSGGAAYCLTLRLDRVPELVTA